MLEALPIAFGSLQSSIPRITHLVVSVNPSLLRLAWGTSRGSLETVSPRTYEALHTVPFGAEIQIGDFGE